MANIYEIVFGLQKKYRFKNCFQQEEEQLLLHAVHNSNVENVEALLNEGIPPDEACQHEVTPLYVAVQNNDKICTKLLVNFGANVNQHFTAIDADDHEIDITPLILASCLNHTEILEILLSAKACIDEKAHNGMNALMFAVANKSIDCVTILTNNAASVNDTDNQNSSSLMIAANIGNVEMIEALISKGANVDHVNSFGNTALVLSILHADEKCIDSLLKAGASTNIRKVDQSNLLMAAQWYAPSDKITNIVTLLVEGGCEVNAQNEIGQTPLFAAIERKSTETIKYLLQAGSDLNKKTIHNVTPLSYAAATASLSEVKLLLEAGADPDCGHPLTTVAHPDTLAHSGAKQVIANQLIIAGANINTVDPEFGTALVTASFIGSELLVMTALHTKAKINVANIYPTDACTKVNNSHTLAMLLASGESCSEVFKQHEYPAVFNFVQSTEKEKKLKNHCRQALRQHLIKIGNKMNLFLLIPSLPLPPLLRSYLLYNMFRKY